jgi:hypothetical protein
LVPCIIDGIDLRIVGAVQITLQLQVVGRVCKDQIDRAGRQAVHHFDAIAIDNRIEWERLSPLCFGLGLHNVPLSPGG